MIFLLWVVLSIVALLTILAIIGRCTSTYIFKPEEQNPMEGKKVRFVADENEKKMPMT